MQMPSDYVLELPNDLRAIDRAVQYLMERTTEAGFETDRLRLNFRVSLTEALANAMHPAFLAASALCLATWVIVLLWLKEVPLRKELEEPTIEPAAPGVAPTRAR